VSNLKTLIPQEEGAKTPVKLFKAYDPGFVHVIDKAPFTITKVLTDNGKEFTDHFCATGQRQPTGAHAFDRVCTANRIEHRLTKPRTPQTNGMSERFNGRSAEVLATTPCRLRRALGRYHQTLRSRSTISTSRRKHWATVLPFRR